MRIILCVLQLCQSVLLSLRSALNLSEDSRTLCCDVRKFLTHSRLVNDICTALSPGRVAAACRAGLRTDKRSGYQVRVSAIVTRLYCTPDPSKYLDRRPDREATILTTISLSLEEGVGRAAPQCRLGHA